MTTTPLESGYRVAGFDIHGENIRSLQEAHPDRGRSTAPAQNTRSAATLGYPPYAMSNPADVGRKLAEQIQSTDPVITADWKAKIGLSLVQRFPSLVRKDRGIRRSSRDAISSQRITLLIQNVTLAILFESVALVMILMNRDGDP